MYSKIVPIFLLLLIANISRTEEFQESNALVGSERTLDFDQILNDLTYGLISNNLGPALENVIDEIKTDLIATYIVPNEIGDLGIDLLNYLVNQIILRVVAFINSVEQDVIGVLVSLLSTS